MKAVYSLLFIGFFMISQIASATVWRVNNRDGVDADFTTLQDAIDGASDGDTLYLGGSPTSYGEGTFTKQLVVFGAGYWLNENDTTQAYQYESKVGVLYFNEGSQGSKVQGMYIYNIGQGGPRYGVSISVDNIEISRNFIYTYVSSGWLNNHSYTVYISGNRSGISIDQNWLWARCYTNSSQYAVYDIYITGVLANSKITNNFIRSTNDQNGYWHAITMSTNSTATELLINNNVIWGSITTYNTIHNNNILISGNYNNGTNDLTSHNLCSGTQYPNENGNQQNVDMETVFLDHDGYIDNDYFLKAGSPAINAGVNGGDCGVFGTGTGTNAYILSGMPPIPSVFEVDMTTVGTTTLPVNIKATSHN